MVRNKPQIIHSIVVSLVNENGSSSSSSNNVMGTRDITNSDRIFSRTSPLSRVQYLAPYPKSRRQDVCNLARSVLVQFSHHALWIPSGAVEVIASVEGPGLVRERIAQRHHRRIVREVGSDIQPQDAQVHEIIDLHLLIDTPQS